ncbi:hypothetical protein [Deinococcus koreensis]|uniref:hypothetical protein n=1 Tax=Deinococcus koreensis TaxID=2054903 RepID=UPI0010570DA0|nr:hypothetical protein [Deinococcus koreensis]
MKFANHSILLIGLLLTSSMAESQSQAPSPVGYKLFTRSHVVGDFEGSDFDKTVELDNGMVCEFRSYHYTYAYRPEAAVFTKILTTADQKRLGVKNPTGIVTLYKLLIEDYSYDVYRLR